MAAIPDTLGANDSLAGQRQTLRHYGELADAAREAELRERAIEDADVRTRKAREAIKALAPSLTEHEAMALISCLQSALGVCGWGHTDHGKAADEGLIDAYISLENAS